MKRFRAISSVGWSRVLPVLSIFLILGQLTGCLFGNKDKEQGGGTSTSPTGPKKAVLTSFDVDPHARFIRPFGDSICWVASSSPDTYLARLKGDRFVALDNGKVIRKFDPTNTSSPPYGLAIKDVMVDGHGNTYVVPDIKSAAPISFQGQEVMGMIKAEDVADPENASWLLVQTGGTADDRLVGGSWVDSIARGFGEDIIVGVVKGGINLGKTQANGAPTFVSGGTRRTAGIEYPEKIVVTTFGQGNDYVVFSKTPGSGSTSAIYTFSKDISGTNQSASKTKNLTAADNFAPSTMAPTNNGKAVWLSSTHANKLGRIVADGSDIAISTDDLTHSSTGLDAASNVAGFAAIGNITYVLLDNGKLYHLDESKLVQDTSGIKNPATVKFIATKFKGLSIGEGWDLAAAGNTLWILDRSKAYRIENADVALDTLKE